nr:hypothetical protein [Lysobacter enzymogenes]
MRPSKNRPPAAASTSSPPSLHTVRAQRRLADRAAVGRQVEHRARAGQIQECALLDRHITAVVAQADAAAVEQLAVARHRAAVRQRRLERIEQGHAGHVQHRVLADPHRLVRAPIIHLRRAVRRRQRRARGVAGQIDAAAVRNHRTQHGGLAARTQAHRAAGVDLHLRTAFQRERVADAIEPRDVRQGAASGRAGFEEEVGGVAVIIVEAAERAVLAGAGGRQSGVEVAAATQFAQRVQVGQEIALRHAQLGAGDDARVVARDQVVGAEIAVAEEAGVEAQGARIAGERIGRRRPDQDVARVQAQRAAAGEAAAAQVLRAEAQFAGAGLGVERRRGQERIQRLGAFARLVQLQGDIAAAAQRHAVLSRGLAVRQDPAAAGHVEQRARIEHDRAAGVAAAAGAVQEWIFGDAQADEAAVDVRAALALVGDAVAVVDPLSAREQAAAGLHGDAAARAGFGIRVVLAGRAERDLARIGLQGAGHVHPRAAQGDAAAGVDLQVRVAGHVDARELVAELDRAEAGLIQGLRGQRAALPLGQALLHREVRGHVGYRAVLQRPATVTGAADRYAELAAQRRRAALALVAPGFGVAAQLTSQHQPGVDPGRLGAGVLAQHDVELAAVAAVHVVGFVVAVRTRERGMEVLAHVPALVVERELAGEAEVGLRRVGPGQAVGAPVRADHPRGFDHAALVMQEAAADVDHRTAAGDEFARTDVDGAAVDQQLVDAARTLVGVAGGVEQRAADPGAAVVGDAALARVEHDLLAVERAAAQQRRIGQFVLADALDSDEVVGHRPLHVGQAGDVDLRAAVDLDARDLGFAGAVAQRLHADQIELGAGHQHQRVFLQAHLRRGQHRVGRLERLVGGRRRGGGLAVALGQDRGDRSAAEAELAAGAAAEIGRLVDAGRTRMVGGHDRDPSRPADRGGGADIAVLMQVVAGQGDRAALAGDDAGVVQAAVADVGRAGLRGYAAVAQAQFVAGAGRRRGRERADHRGQLRVAVFGGHAAGVAEVRRGDQGVAAGTGLDLRAGVDADVAGGLRPRRGAADELGQFRGQHRHVGLGPAHAFADEDAVALGDVVAEEVQRRHQQRAGIDLAGAAEHHAVAVEQIDAAFGLDLAEDLAGPAAGIVDPVERDPVVAAAALVAAALVEVDRGAAADVEAFPAQDRLLLGLFDGDGDVAGRVVVLARALGAEPQLGLVQARVFDRDGAGFETHAGGDLEPALDQAVGHLVGRARRRRRGARGHLRGIERGAHARGLGERRQRALRHLLRLRRLQALLLHRCARLRGRIGAAARERIGIRVRGAADQRQRNRRAQREQAQARGRRTARGVTGEGLAGHDGFLCAGGVDAAEASRDAATRWNGKELWPSARASQRTGGRDRGVAGKTRSGRCGTIDLPYWSPSCCRVAAGTARPCRSAPGARPANRRRLPARSCRLRS